MKYIAQVLSSNINISVILKLPLNTFFGGWWYIFEVVKFAVIVEKAHSRKYSYTGIPTATVKDKNSSKEGIEGHKFVGRKDHQKDGRLDKGKYESKRNRDPPPCLFPKCV